MADELDRLIVDYVTGMLAVKINAHEKWITRQIHEENIGGSKQPSNTAPQERRLITIEEDTKLQKMKDQQEILDQLIGTVSDELRDTIKYKFKYRLNWDQVGQRMLKDSSGLRKKYKDFKETVRKGLWAHLM